MFFEAVQVKDISDGARVYLHEVLYAGAACVSVTCLLFRDSKAVMSNEDQTNPLQIDASSIRQPEVAIRTLRQAPLLPAKQQKFFFTEPDATINVSSESLFAHLEQAEQTEAFQYGGPNRLGTQSAYLNVPHMVQKNLVPLMLPNAKEAAFGNQPFALPFPHLQKGDIAFYLRLENDWNTVEVQRSFRNPGIPCTARTPLSLVCQGWDERVQHARKRCRTSDAGESAGVLAGTLVANEGSHVFVNLQTVNYILHGIQHFRDTEPYWRDSFWRGFGLHRLDRGVTDDPERLSTHVLRWCMTPFGVVASDTTQSSDQGVAMVVDGRLDGGMRNYWASFVPDAGRDDLLSASASPGRRRNSRKKHAAWVMGSNAAPNEVALPQPGDELILVLREVKVNLEASSEGFDDDEALQDELDRWTYALPNRKMHDAVRMTFPLKWPAHTQGMVGPRPREHSIWQLVPSFASAANPACWERQGFWRLGVVF